MQCRNTQQYTRQKGALAEQYAATFLYRRGYTILHRNWRVRMGEIDIIARNGRTLVFVEVKALVTQRSPNKARNPAYFPEDHVDERKAARLARLAELFLVKHAAWSYDYQIDVIAVLIDRQRKKAIIRHYPNAISV
ncbi:MAG: hypothetical protein A2666_03610 [Parcubacteria group bacterium RIFCSPHIGHO2_01_FULL_47_10b]|nr:MAG: hypothetical protein A2666_03610 [Parcubacteria group bacterium RIFCSPHIGHO2_01_FULL_47_10b]